MRIARLLFLTSLILTFSLSWADSKDEFLNDLNRAATRQQVEAVIDKHEGLFDAKDAAEVRSRLASGENFREVRESLPSLLTRSSVKSVEPKGALAKPSDEARKILASPEFRDSGSTTQRNWLSKSLNNLGEALGNWLLALLRQNTPQAVGGFSLGIGSALIYVVLGVLGLALLAGLIYLLTKWRWAPKSVKKGGGGLLEDDEPDRSADEWLEMADSLEAKGQHREAVRCLYLACLVRLDENKVADFMRGETNWEHLRRIHASPKRPSDWEFRTATQKFDLVWYGKEVKGKPDTDWFRGFYQDLISRLAVQAKAA